MGAIIGTGMVIVLLAVMFFLLIFRPLRVVRDYERLVVFRLGRYAGEQGPGLVWLWPVIDQAVKANLREDFLEIPSQTCITQDNAPIDIDFLIYWKVVDPGLQRAQGARLCGRFAGHRDHDLARRHRRHPARRRAG